VVERSFAWARRFRRLAKDYERLPETVAGLHFVALVTIHLASDLATNARRAGVFISSGSVAARAQDVADALCARGFRLEQQCSQNAWRGMAFRKV
jgi:ribosomal protein L11 methylase PrmA